MNVIFSCLIMTGVLFSLTGCGSKDESLESIDSISAEITKKTSNSSTEEQSVFKGCIESIAETTDTTLQVKVVDIKEIRDPENIGTSFASDGVILNVSVDQLDGGKEAYYKGETIKFVLAGNGMMTASIPPQIPGNSIIKVVVVK
ncbi:lipoprotein [Enterococcus ratti]|uniref:Uncharacterized protein n=1 Tax=Enterococcus ratti TaxID=150033 RepID=A0A1L8WP67_9ENTE|nr:hypothetical protein [Enterococcus ratti]OJG82823.1 hypothetical protein RV14_GL002115 [Enterococcus ratti]